MPPPVFDFDSLENGGIPSLNTNIPFSEERDILESLEKDIKLLDLNKKIDSLSKEISKYHNQYITWEGKSYIDRVLFGLIDEASAGTGGANSLSQSRNETDSVNSVRARKDLLKKRDSIKQND